MTPLLSICVPTFNRAAYLEGFLANVLPQVEKAGQSVELLISDNASEDETGALLDAQSCQRLRVRRNERNVGALRNVFLAVADAHGEYVWVLGDDDRLRSDGLAQVLETIREHPSLDGFFLNCITISAAAFEGDRTFARTQGFCRESRSQPLDRWEDFVALGAKPGIGTSIVQHVFRKRVWDDASAAVMRNLGESDALFTSVEMTFPTTVVLARAMVGKPSFYVGDALVCVTVGAQDWFGKWPSLLLEFGLVLADQFLALGASVAAATEYRRLILGNRVGWRKVLDASSEAGQHARSRFQLDDLIRREGNHRELWQGLCGCVRLLSPGDRWAFWGIVRGGWRFAPFWRSFLPRWFGVRLTALARRVSRALPAWAKRSLTSSAEAYTAEILRLDRMAGGYFRSAVNCAGDATVHHPVFVRRGDRIQVGSRFTCGAGCRFEAWDEYHGKAYDPRIVFGDGVSFGFWCHVGAIDRIEIGNRVLIGSGVLVTDHDHEPGPATQDGRDPRGGGLVSKGPVVIEDDVWIGEHASILAGVRIGRGAVIGANSVVTRDVAPYTTVGGVPARVLETGSGVHPSDRPPPGREQEGEA